MSDRENEPEQESDVDDDFGDFNEFTAFEGQTPVEDQWAESSEVTSTQDDNWASFATSSFQKEVVEDVPLPNFDEVTFEDLLDDIFCVPDTNDINDHNLPPSIWDRLADCDNNPGDELEEYIEVWKKLRVIEESPALNYRWGDNANVFLSYLQSLHIDHNLAKMRNSNLPAFAQDLGTALTPLKGGESPKKSSLQPQIDSLSVPPVSFDWSNSGLTNPLTKVSNTSAILDLDYLSSSELKSHSKTSALQKDLESLGLGDTGPEPNVVAKSDKLDQVLKDSSKLTWNAAQNLPGDNPSSSLPDLGYMLSNVLMFPINK